MFPIDRKVKLDNGESVAMSELKTGDRVQIGEAFIKVLQSLNLCLKQVFADIGQ